MANYADLLIQTGNFLQSHGTFSDADPYVAFEHNGQNYKTQVHKSSGLNPIWNQRFRLSNLGPPNTVYFQVYNKGLLSDKLIGETSVLKLDDLQMGTTKIELMLWDKNKKK